MEKINYPSTSASDDAGSAVVRGLEGASSALHAGIDKVVEPARRAVDSASSTAHKTVDKIASSATHTADRFSEQTRRVTEAPEKALEFTKSWVQDKPLEAVGAALALGFIIGRLTSR
jgi:ElaB/YqjD/DUF883 family membrane-anchored ribosome-binding protein